MDPRTPHLALAALLAAALAACSPAEPDPIGPRPDILLISVDTLRADRVGAWGHTRETTPFLDRVAESGVRFARALAPAPHTAPSHMSLFTGLDPLSHGVRNMSAGDKSATRVAATIATLPEELALAGYRTAAFTDRGNLLPAMGFERGFEVSEAAFEALPRKLARVRRYLTEVPADEPLFLFFHTYAVHAPYLPPAPHAGLFTDPDYQGEFRRRFEELSALDPLGAWEQARDFLEPFDGIGAADYDYLSALYDEGVHWADAELAKLWRAWNQVRDPENTLLVITSDHGEELGEAGRLGHHYGLSRELLHVPLLMRGPGLAVGHTVQAPVGLGALPSTLFELLQLPAPDHQSGSLLALARGAQQTGEAAYAQDFGAPRRGRLELVAKDELRLVRRFAGDEPASWLHRWEELGDGSIDRSVELDADERELRELLDARRMDGIKRSGRHHSTRVAPDADERELAALGYTGEDD